MFLWLNSQNTISTVNRTSQEYVLERTIVFQQMRTTLAQLRSDWGLKLNIYLNLIYEAITDNCSDCGVRVEDESRGSNEDEIPTY